MGGENDVLRERVCRAAGRAFRIEPSLIGPDDGPGSIEAWDSLGHLTLMMEIEREFSVRFSTDQISQTRTIRGVVALVLDALSNGQ